MAWIEQKINIGCCLGLSNQLADVFTKSGVKTEPISKILRGGTGSYWWKINIDANKLNGYKQD